MKEECTLIRTRIPARLDDTEFLKHWGFTATSCCLCNVDIRNTGGRLLQCARCKVAHYCTLACLQKDFLQHKEVCLLAHQAKLKFLEEAGASNALVTIDNEALVSSEDKVKSRTSKEGAGATSRSPATLNNESVSSEDNGKLQRSTGQRTPSLDIDGSGVEHNDPDVSSHSSGSSDGGLARGSRCKVNDKVVDRATGTSFCVDKPQGRSSSSQGEDEVSSDANSVGSAGSGFIADDTNLIVEDDSRAAEINPEPTDGKLGGDRRPQYSPNTRKKLISVGKLPSESMALFDAKPSSSPKEYAKKQQGCTRIRNGAPSEPSTVLQDNASDYAPAKKIDPSMGETDDHVDGFDLDENQWLPVGDVNHRKIGRLDMPQYSPKTRKQLIRVGKLPGSSTEAFDGKAPPLFYNRFQQGEPLSPRRFGRGVSAPQKSLIKAIDVNDARADKDKAHTVEIRPYDTQADDGNQGASTPHLRPNSPTDLCVESDKCHSPASRGVGKLQATDGNCRSPMSGRQVGKLPSAARGAASFDKTALSPGKLPPGAFKTCSDVDRGFRHGDNGKGDLAPGKLCTKATGVADKNTAHGMDVQPCDVQADDDNEGASTPHLRPDSPTDLCVESDKCHSPTSRGGGKLQATDGNCLSPMSGRQVGKLPSAARGAASFDKTALSPGKLPPAAFKTCSDGDRGFRHGDNGKGDLAPGKLCTKATDVVDKNTTHGMDVQPCDVQADDDNEGASTPHLRPDSPTDLCVESDKCHSPTSRGVGKLQATDGNCLSPMSGRQVGKLPSAARGAASFHRAALSPGKLPPAAFKTYYNTDGCASGQNNPNGNHPSERRDFKSLDNSLIESFDGHRKDSPKTQLGMSVDHLTPEATRCFEHPASPPRRAPRSPGKLPSFAMRAFSPRTPSQDRLPPAFSKLKLPAQRKWKSYKPRETLDHSIVDSNKDS